MTISMDRLKVGETGEGAASIAYSSLVQGAGVEAKLSFKEYLRFVDMGVGRGHPLGGLKTVRVELKSRKNGGNKFVKDDTFKPRKIYARVVYGKLTPMYNRLLYGFTQETIDMLKKELEQANQTPLQP
ncbi:MAG: hypothetical protein V4594_16735 [Bacteroidota bacterium]